MHFIALVLFAALVGVAFSLLNSEVTDTKGRVFYGVKVFAAFVGIGLAIAWIMFPFPR